MDNQMIFNAAVSLAGFLGGWVLNNIYKAIERLEEEARTSPAEYDFRSDGGAGTSIYMKRAGAWVGIV